MARWWRFSPSGEQAMMRRYNRLLVLFYVVSDSVLAMVAFLLAYIIRFELLSVAFPITKGYPPLEQYLRMLPFIQAIVPIAFYAQGLYHLRRGRTRVDDFFAVFVGTILAVVIGVGGTLYFQAYYVSEELKDAGIYEISQLVWAMFLVVNVIFAYTSRELIREALERRWKAGIGLKRVLIAGAGDLGRLVADKVLEHRELGFKVFGFIDDRATGDHIGYRGLPLLGTLADADDIIRREKIDHLYVALPLEEHVKMLGLVEATNREGVDVHVVPDLLQFIALRARLENLDGVPIISLNDVPLRGFNSILKRGIDIAISGAALLGLGVPFLLISGLIKRTSPGPVFYRQERMGLDGKAFQVFKFRSMEEGAEDETGPVWARDNDPRCTPVGRWLRRFDLDELPQLWNVLRGDMSIVGPRPERPYFVEQFKHRIPQYMLRHKVKAGITGWAQVNGWRGNTSLEKRIEYDLYYIENWSVGLDLKIMWLTLLKGLQKHAY
jgi:Undecaprenyl-phosphate glucose phosphotransferase